MPQLVTTPQAAASWLATHVRGTLRSDSRALFAGDGFIAVPGQTHDGRCFVAQALAAGAAACLVEAEGVDQFAFDDPRIAALPGLKAACGAVADIYFGAPSARLDVVASTGTNGKTSTTWWTAQALTALGRRCAVMGTLGIGEPPPAGPAAAAPRDAGTAGNSGDIGDIGDIGDTGGIGDTGNTADTADTSALRDSGLTTPDAVTLHAALRDFADRGFAACALEASSIGLVEHRLAGARISVALFTNLTRDHLDHHGDMAAYGAAKRMLFTWPGLRAAVINVDDPFGAELAASLAGGLLDVWTVSLLGAARLRGADLHYTAQGLAFTACEDAANAAVHSRQVGDYNASNLLVVLGGLRALGVPLADAAAALAGLTPVPGRLQRLTGAGIEVVVDYAHTPDAIDKALQALRPLAVSRGGQLVCVFGCGGNRDSSKRPLMGAIAERGADRVILTSDNPRHEDPAAILAQIVAGLARPDVALVIEDRRVAIRRAVADAADGDVLLIAGKGHEAEQDIAGVKRPFSDLIEARQALAARAAHRGSRA